MKIKFYMVVIMLFATTMAFSQVSFTECDAPEHLQVSNVTSNTGIFSWLPAPDTYSWIIEVGPVGFTPGMGEYVIKDQVVLTIPALSNYCKLDMENLEPVTQYHVYIRTECQYNEEWIGPLFFMTRPELDSKKSASLK